jgi:2-hydroxychromene-2-carboxylate isomerase
MGGQGMLDFWYELASTYSYPAAMRIEEAAAAADVKVRWRPFLLGPIFKQQGWTTSPFNVQPDKGRYMWRDLERICGGMGLPLRPPEPFPQHSLTAARIATIGQEQGWGPAFAKAVYRAEFGDGRNISDPATLADILQALGLDAVAMLKCAETPEIKAALRAATEEAMRLGIFGAPTFIAGDGELFWGNDRLEQAINWARCGMLSSCRR